MRFAIATVALLLASGCATPLDPSAQQVRQIQPGTPGCRMLGVVEVEGGLFYSSRTEATRDMLNKVRLETARRGGNAFATRDVMVERGFSLPFAQAEAYACPG